MSTVPVKYPLDPTGVAAGNLVSNEPHVLPVAITRVLVMEYGAFFTDSLVIVDAATSATLVQGTDYYASEMYELATMEFGKNICSVIVITNQAVSTNVLVTAQMLGGEFSYSYDAIVALVNQLNLDNRPVAWGNLLNKPAGYTPSPHLHDAGDLYGFEYIVTALERITQAISIGRSGAIDAIYNYIDAQNELIQSDLAAYSNLWGYVPVNKTGDSMSGCLKLNGGVEINSYSKTSAVPITANTGTTNIDLSLGEVFVVTVAASTLLVLDNTHIPNLTSTDSFSFKIILVNNSTAGYTVVVTNPVRSNVSPAPQHTTVANGRDEWNYITYDGGSTFTGTMLYQDVAPLVNTVAPVVSGISAVGNVLSSTQGTWTGYPLPTFGYQWRNGTTVIADANNPIYTVQSTDTLSQICCAITATNSNGYLTAVSNYASQSATAPTNTVIPALTGTPNVGNKLSVTPGTWTGTSPIGYRYQWLNNAVAIGGATNFNYTLQNSDIGAIISCNVIATNIANSVTQVSNSSVNIQSQPINSIIPTVSGVSAIGQTLTVDNGTWLGYPAPTFKYQWQDGSTNITEATGNTYTVQESDAGSQINCVVTATNTNGSASASSIYGSIIYSAPVGVLIPVVTGTLSVGSTLTSSTGTWLGYPAPTITYQWLSNGVAITEQFASMYTLLTTDISNTISCRVTATNIYGVISATSVGGTVIGSAPTNSVTPTITVLGSTSTLVTNIVAPTITVTDAI